MLLLELLLTLSVFCPLLRFLLLGFLLPDVIAAACALWEGHEGGDKEGL